MFKTHTTREGNSMLIAQMTNEHLTNTVLLFVRKADEVKRMAEANNLNEYERTLYGIENVTLKDAALATKEAMEYLYPYLAECYLRDLEIPRKVLVEFLDRDEKLVSDFPLLLEAEYENSYSSKYSDEHPCDGEDAKNTYWG